MYRHLNSSGAVLVIGVFLVASPMASAQEETLSPSAAFAGCYAGVHGGGMVGRTSSRELFEDYARYGQQKATFSAMLVGGQLGCNWTSGDMVFGLEGEAFVPLEQDGSTAIQILGQPTYRNRLWYKSETGGAVSLRAGAVFNSMLFFGKLGVAYAPVTVTHEHEFGSYPTGSIPGPGQPFENGQSIDTKGTLARASLLLGAGVEYAIAPSWSLKMEYNLLLSPEGTVSATGTSRDYSYSTTDGSFSQQPPVNVTRAKSMSEMRNVVKFGINRRF